MENKSFEELLKELESVVNSLENKDISLDDAVKNYEKGLELSKKCYEMFSSVEEKIVKRVDNGEISPFKLEEYGDIYV